MHPFFRTLKVAWGLSWAVLLTLILFFPITISSLLSSTGNLAFNFSKLWAWIMLKVMRVGVRVENKEAIKAGQSYIIVANHQSTLDILAIVTALGIQFRWVIKKELLRIPLFGYALYASKNIFIDRSNAKKAVQSINRGIKRIPPGVGMIFFVEGTRSKDGQLKRFKKGAFATAIGNDLPILPVIVNDAAKLMPKGSLFYRSGVVELIIGNPIETEDYNMEDITKLMEKTRETIIANLSS